MAEHHLVIPDTVQAIAVTTIVGRDAKVVMNFLVPLQAAATPEAANAMFDSLKALWTANIGPHCAASTALNALWLRDLRQPNLPLVQSTTGGVAGTSPTGQALPRQIAACLTVRTNRAGRSYRGRMYWAGFAEAANGADNHMEAATKTSLDAFAAGFIGAVNLSGWQFGVAHRPTLYDEDTGLPVAPGLGFTTPATQVVCRDSVWDNQRRRAA